VSKRTAGGRSSLGRGALALTAILALGCNHKEVSGPKKPHAASATPIAPSPVEEEKHQKRAEPSTDAAADAAPAAVPAKRTYKVAALGDSITDERVGGGTYLHLLAQLCPGSRFENFGKGGDMTNQMRRRFESDILPRALAGEFDTLLYYGGVNDLYSDETALRTNEKIKEDMLRVFRAAKEAKLRVVVFTVSPWGGFTRYFSERRGENTRLINSFLLGLPHAQPPLVDAVVDTYPLLSCGVPTHLCTDYQLKRPDGIHPGPAGHRRIFELAYEKAFSDCQ
jgi:lysophospholipase L1-like esterase